VTGLLISGPLPRGAFTDAATTGHGHCCAERPCSARFCGATLGLRLPGPLPVFWEALGGVDPAQNIEGHALCQSGQRCRGEGREAQAASDLGAPLWRMCYGRHSTCDWPGSDCTHSHEGGGHCCGCCRVSGDTPQRGSGPVCCLGGDLEEAGEANQRATSSGRAETAWA